MSFYIITFLKKKCLNHYRIKELKVKKKINQINTKTLNVVIDVKIRRI